MADALQFYPTPNDLASRAWSLFHNRNYLRVLEPSAGRGDLLDARRAAHRNPWHRADVIEINLAHHATLREKGYQVVDLDFLQYRSPVGYSHLIMNPPFAHGVDHVLHAWDLLRDGELVAILNAETIDNPYTEKRRFLATLIEEHGEVDYVESAFQDPDTLRRTDVRVALVHLTKRGETRLPDLTDLLVEDDGDRMRVDADKPQELALPASTIQNTVRAFDAAVEAMQRAVVAEATASYYAGLIEVKRSPEERECNGDGDGSHKPPVPVMRFENLQNTLNERYDRIKENAWLTVLRATEFTSRFTNKVQAEIEQQLDGLRKMEFTVANVYSLLEGLLASKTDLDLQSLEDAFDSITRYHSDNRVYFRGWKSNDKHRLGWRIRTTRFILPNMGESFGDGLGWQGERELQDIDRAFALMDGKTDPDFGMVAAARESSSALCRAQRLESDYFEIRFYKGAGTLHCFPTRPDLVAQLNRLVGQRRQWLPDPQERVPEAFWLQYDKAEKIGAAIGKAHRANARSSWGVDEEELIAEGHDAACQQLGIPVWSGLGRDAGEPEQLPLLARSEVAETGASCQ